LITGGRLGDRYGTKRLFLAGMTVFTVASLVAGVAPEVDVLIAARVLQGVGSGLMVPQVLSFIFAEFDEKERPKAMTLFAAAFPVGGMAGPLLGGLLTQANLFDIGWRAIFLVNLPIGVIAVAGALLTMPSRPGFMKHRIDTAGLVLLTIAGFATFYPLVQGRELGWPLWSIGLMVAAIPLFGLFVYQQRATARHGGEPLIALGLFRSRSLAAGQAILLCVNTAIGVFFVLTLHLQMGLGFTPLAAALTFLPATIGIIVGNVLAMRLAPRFGRSFIAASIGVLLASLAAVAVVVGWLGDALTAWALAIPVVGFGLGMGAALNALFTTSMSEVKPDQAGSASGIVNTTMQLGTATGIALFGTVFFTQLDSGYVPATTAALIVSIGVLVVALVLTAALPPQVRSADDSWALDHRPAAGASIG
jgi:MFS family permease